MPVQCAVAVPPAVLLEARHEVGGEAVDVRELVGVVMHNRSPKTINEEHQPATDILDVLDRTRLECVLRHCGEVTCARIGGLTCLNLDHHGSCGGGGPDASTGLAGGTSHSAP